jgi:purine-binding chemotaxis protein CheW
MDTLETTPPAEPYLTFAIGDDTYAVGLRQVREILEYPAVTRVPRAPRWIRGVINLRGRVVPVADLAVAFGQSPAPVTRRTCVVIVEVTLDGQPAIAGVVADSVCQVIDLRRADIGPPPDFGTRTPVDYLAGMGRVDAGFVLVLDLDRALAPGDASTVPGEAESAEGAIGQTK